MGLERGHSEQRERRRGGSNLASHHVEQVSGELPTAARTWRCVGNMYACPDGR